MTPFLRMSYMCGGASNQLPSGLKSTSGRQSFEVDVGGNVTAAQNLRGPSCSTGEGAGDGEGDVAVHEGRVWTDTSQWPEMESLVQTAMRLRLGEETKPLVSGGKGRDTTGADWRPVSLESNKCTTSGSTITNQQLTKAPTMLSFSEFSEYPLRSFNRVVVGSRTWSDPCSKSYRSIPSVESDSSQFPFGEKTGGCKGWPDCMSRMACTEG
mmetsp:Transcript_21377/g.35363  ORF Transcript_21377/g.35363 Transcript_21377/m.35363 type:complete len:211 (-) Transcript_21377:2156-2788(-)